MTMQDGKFMVCCKKLEFKVLMIINMRAY